MNYEHRNARSNIHPSWVTSIYEIAIEFMVPFFYGK